MSDMVKGPVLAELSAFKNLYYTTVRIHVEEEDGTEGFGTGFFFRIRHFGEHGSALHTDLLITNKHVVEGASKGFLVLHLGPTEEGIPQNGTFKLIIDDFESKFIDHPDPEIDLCALDFEPYIAKVKKETGYPVHYEAFTESHLPSDDELKALYPARDIFMVGYPNGLWDEVNNLPITRKGVSASHLFYDFNGKSKGVADIGTFTGSSGSPMIIFEWGPPLYDSPPDLPYRLLGVLKSAGYIDVEGSMVEASVPTRKREVPLFQVMTHLGYYIKAKELNVFEKLFTPTSKP